MSPLLKRVYAFIAVLFALLLVNSIYLVGTTLTEKAVDRNVEDGLYLWMFFGHLVLGIIITVPVVAFGCAHLRTAWSHPNHRARTFGLMLFASSIVLLATGFVLTRVDIGTLRLGAIDPSVRMVNYVLHLVTPIAVMVLFILHRKVSGRFHWRRGVKWGVFAVGAFAVVGVWHAAVLSSQGRSPVGGAEYFQPSLVQTATGTLVDPSVFDFDSECIACHADSVKSHAQSVHSMSSFNNPFYTFSVRQTRKAMYERDGNVHASRFCAGCHDPVPFLTGAFELEKWDDPDYDLSSDPAASASITCTACHGIVGLQGVLGNGGYTFEAPEPYPFQGSDSSILKWINHALIKARPSFHKRSFLKPEIHKSAEFCAACHKVSIPEELTQYKWLRGQDHYDSWRLSGVSGFGIESWYYPPKAETNCNGCHMAAMTSADLGAERMDDSAELKIPSHAFPSANPALAAYLDRPDKQEILDRVAKFNEGIVRVDLFAIHDGPTIESQCIAPLRPLVPELTRGNDYVLDVVVRTLKLGHAFTQGTADSNEVWIEVEARTDGRLIGSSGRMSDDGSVDPWSKFLNSYVIDQDGNHIVLRNVQDLFTSLYNHQIPPGAADLTHYALHIPEDAGATIDVTVRVRYRKFTQVFLEAVAGHPIVNELPIIEIASDVISFPVAGGAHTPVLQSSPIVPWQRWYDYGIGALRQTGSGARGDLRAAGVAFAEVERLIGGTGALATARALLIEGRIDDAAEAIARAGMGEIPASPWMREYWVARVNRERGALDEAIAGFERVLETPWEEAQQRQFDFSHDDRVHTILAETYFERSRSRAGENENGGASDRERAVAHLSEALVLDPESVAAWYTMMQLCAASGDSLGEGVARAHYLKYKPDDNALDRAMRLAREMNPAANHAAEAIVIYDLHRGVREPVVP
ncbi:MAG: multiheme c-type cytochrome [Planctomycetota bacterium]|nr:multiheme c-type cytochrome [Planctomycetota bacterium]